MIIKAYDNVTEAKYDLEGLQEYIQSCMDFKEQEKRTVISKAESYCSGYRDAMENIASILGASNYRVKEG
jgi:hypothetical protein